jgi:hypothetical protein
MEVTKTLCRENRKKPHKLQVKIKRTNSQQEVEQHIPKIEAYLEDMDLDVNIENIQFPKDDQRLQETQQLAAELYIQEEVFSEEVSNYVQNNLFDIAFRKLIFERSCSKNKRESPMLNLTSLIFLHIELLSFIKLQGMFWMFR